MCFHLGQDYIARHEGKFVQVLVEGCFPVADGQGDGPVGTSKIHLPQGFTRKL